MLISLGVHLCQRKHYKQGENKPSCLLFQFDQVLAVSAVQRDEAQYRGAQQTNQQWQINVPALQAIAAVFRETIHKPPPVAAAVLFPPF